LGRQKFSHEGTYVVVIGILIYCL